MEIRTPGFNAAVNVLRAHLRAANVNTPLHVTQEAFARALGFDDWHAMQAFEARSKRMQQQATKVFDFEPQMTEVKHGSEPSLRKVLMHYYTSHGIALAEAERLVSDYLKAASQFVDTEARRRLLTSKDAFSLSEVLDRAADVARNYDLGTPEGHAIADCIKAYKDEVTSVASA